MISGRRRVFELYTGAGQDIYSFRFDTLLLNRLVEMSVEHAVNVPFSFQHIAGMLDPRPKCDSA